MMMMQKKDDENEEEERGGAGAARGFKAAAAAAAAAAARSSSFSAGDHDGGEHHERVPFGSGRRRGNQEGGEGQEDGEEDEDEDDHDTVTVSDSAERDKFRFAAHFIDRASFWLLLCGYCLAAVLIFSLSWALAPGDCAQFAQQSLIDECRSARRAAEVRQRSGVAGR